MQPIRRRRGRLCSNSRSRRNRLDRIRRAGQLRHGKAAFRNGRGLFRSRGAKPLAQLFLMQRVIDDLPDGLRHGAFILKANLQLIGMNVHVHVLIGHFQKQGAHGELADHDPALAAIFQRPAQYAAAEKTPIDEKALLLAVSPGKLPHADESADGHAALVPADGDHLTESVLAIQAEQGGVQLTVAHTVVDGFALTDEAERDLRVGQDQPEHIVRHQPGLDGGLFQELPADGGIIEQILHHEGGAHRRGGLTDVGKLAALHLTAHAELRVGGLGGAGHFRHRRHGGQRLAAEAQRVDAVQLRFRLQLAGGVTFEGQPNLPGGNALAVVRNAQVLDTASPQLHRDVGRPRVDGVFHQFLHHGSGAFHHLACGDFSDQFRR